MSRRLLAAAYAAAAYVAVATTFAGAVLPPGDPCAYAFALATAELEAGAAVVLPPTLAVAAAANLPRSGDFCKGILQVSRQSAKYATTTRRKV